MFQKRTTQVESTSPLAMCSMLIEGALGLRGIQRASSYRSIATIVGSDALHGCFNPEVDT